MTTVNSLAPFKRAVRTYSRLSWSSITERVMREM